MLKGQLGAAGGDAAEAYVIAHEYGHHISNLTGVLAKAQSSGNTTGPASAQVRLELQADCYAGAWLKNAASDPISPIKSITADDVNRAVDAALAVGDDRIQLKSTGAVTPESWTHGSSAMRKRWLAIGFNDGDPSQCNTFTADALRQRLIKYLGSKRRLVAEIGRLFTASGALTALDLFTGTTRVAQEFCRRGGFVTCVDTAAYAEVLAQCYIVTDAGEVDPGEINEAIRRLSALPERRGYVTEVFCERARYFHPDNGVRIDAIRDGIDDLYGDSPLRPLLLTSLLEAADRVDSTVGVQMAYLKEWAPRALRPLRLVPPVLAPGTGRALRGNAATLVRDLEPVDLAYLDPPYNQHRYFNNYHVWETLIRWDAPEHYGVACKRVDARDDDNRSPFNSRRTMPEALGAVIADVRATTVVVSFSNEGFVPLAELVELCAVRGHPVEVLSFDTRRYIGHRLGVFGPDGRKVGVPGPERNTEYMLVSTPDPDLLSR